MPRRQGSRSQRFHLTDLHRASHPSRAQQSFGLQLAEQQFAGATPEIRTELIWFFEAPGSPSSVKKDPKAWAKVQSELEQLKNLLAEHKIAGAAK